MANCQTVDELFVSYLHTMNTQTTTTGAGISAAHDEFAPRHYETPCDESFPIGQVRCVGVYNGGNLANYWTGRGWATNKCYAKRYKTSKAAKIVATRKGGKVLRFYRDNGGNYPLRHA